MVEGNSTRGIPAGNGRTNRESSAVPDDFDPSAPRIGRRESEPHSAEVSYLHDVLCANFPADRSMWDLHHYFMLDGEEIDFCFDISFFKGLRIDHTLSSYRSAEHGGRVPDLVINVLSKSTWIRDVGEIVDTCRALGIPVYVIFSPYDVASRVYKPPFIRVYVMDAGGRYEIHELREITLKEGDTTVNWNNIIDCSGRLPFTFGLMERQVRHAKDLPLYRLVLLDVDAKKLLPSLLEQEMARAEQEKARAEQEKARADKAIAELQRLRNA